MAKKLIIFSLLIISFLAKSLSNNKFLPKKYIHEETYSKNNKNEINKKYSIFKNFMNFENTIEMKILNVSGELFEYKRGQILNIFINLKKDLFNAEEIKNITLLSLNKSKLYIANTECHYKAYYINANITNIYCYLDLTKVPKGVYLINHFYYQTKKINDRNTLLNIKEEQKKGNKTEIPKLIYVNSSAYEYMDYQNISLYFNTNDFNYNLINCFAIYKNQTVFNVSLDCLGKIYNNSAFCLANLKNINSGKYNIIYYVYNNILINVMENISFYVYKKNKTIEEDLKLISIYGVAYSNTNSLFKLIFNKDVNVNYFSRFYLTDIKPYLSYAYYLNFSFYKNEYNKSVDCLFDFKRVPIGSYLLNFIYKNKTYPTNLTLTVKETEIIAENDLLDVYSNFKKKKNNQTAYFSFNGRNRNKNLAYIVLKNEYSNIYVLQTFDCKITDYNSISFDLKCNINLTYVEEGKYSISEYYINNEHYYTKKNINVIVQ